MVYNVGSHDHPLGDVGVKVRHRQSNIFSFYYISSFVNLFVQVNDNVYHVVRFSRRGANATLQVDDYDVQVNQPQGMYFSYKNGYPTFRP